jgi:hypothetical protein
MDQWKSAVRDHDDSKMWQYMKDGINNIDPPLPVSFLMFLSVTIMTEVLSKNLGNMSVAVVWCSRTKSFQNRLSYKAQGQDPNARYHKTGATRWQQKSGIASRAWFAAIGVSPRMVSNVQNV